jgi:hypothetical protein
MGLGSSVSVWNNKCLIWQDKYSELMIFGHSSIVSGVERGIVKIKLVHEYPFKSS